MFWESLEPEQCLDSSIEGLLARFPERCRLGVHVFFLLKAPSICLYDDSVF